MKRADYRNIKRGGFFEKSLYLSAVFSDNADITGVSINTALGRMRYAVLNMRRIAAEKSISLVME